MISHTRIFSTSTSSDDEEARALAALRARGGELGKAFKAEVDALTRRARHGESAFLSLYRLLREAPDPLVLVRICPLKIVELAVDKC